MTPPTFRIGDEVIIIGPTVAGHCDFTGHKFKIDCECHGTYAGEGYPWYPAGSLRLVEELKIGDWVEIIGPSRHGFSEAHGVQFKIEQVLGDEYSAPGVAWYRAKCLRKLTPDEVLCHLTKRSGFTIEQRLNSLEEYAKENDARVSAIEKRQDEAREYSDNLYKITETQARRIYDLQKRVDFLEAFQKDAATHATYMTYTYKPGEKGTITVHCPCGRKHEIEATPRTYQADSEASRKDEAELASLCPNGHQIPNGEPIRVAIERGDEAHTYCDTCPGECLNWSEKVLDDMRVD